MDSMYVRLIDPRTGQLLREHLGRSVADIASAMRIAQAHTAAYHQLLARLTRRRQHRRRLRREPRPAAREKANDNCKSKSKNKGKDKSDKEAGQRTPAASRLVIQKPLPTEPHIGIMVKTRNPLTARLSDKPQRVSITDSFGASPASSPWITPQGAIPAERVQP